ncbi:MAG: hypothetical protein RL701_6669 [Pseudomonadota bacterium]|jgi:uncharacterized protein
MHASNWRARALDGVCFASVLLGLFLSTAVVDVVHAFEAPALTGCVNDQANMLSDDARQRLTQRLSEFRAQVGPHFALLTVQSLNGLSVEEFSIRTVEAWKLGSTEKDDGLLLLVSKREHKLRIEVGRGLEGEIPDAIASRIIREILTPALKEQAYDRGIEATFDALIVRAGGLSDPKRATWELEPEVIPDYIDRVFWLGLFLPFVALLGLVIFFGRRYAAKRGVSGSHHGPSLSGSYSSRSSSSSGSGSSGGGGSFAGGGASGSW